MAAGRWQAMAETTAAGIALAFSKEAAAAVKNPFDVREPVKKSAEELAEIEAAKARVAAIRERVAERQRARHGGPGTDGTG